MEKETMSDELKSRIVLRFSDFVDGVLDDELKIPDEIREFAKKGKLYHDLVEDDEVIMVTRNELTETFQQFEQAFLAFKNTVKEKYDQKERSYERKLKRLMEINSELWKKRN